MSQLSLITLEIHPGRVPDARALLRNAPILSGLIAWKFVETGVVNTLIGFVRSEQSSEVSAWARELLKDRPAFLRGLRHEIYRGELPDELLQSPAVLLHCGPECTQLLPMTGNLIKGIELHCTASLDAALAMAVSLRETSAQEILLLIPEALRS